MQYPHTRLNITYNPALYDDGKLIEPQTAIHHRVALYTASTHASALFSLIALIDESKITNTLDLMQTLESVGALGAAIADDISAHLEAIEDSQDVAEEFIANFTK